MANTLYRKANNALSWNTSTSWSPVGLPNSTDLALFDSLFAAGGSTSLTANRAVGKIQLTNCLNSPTIISTGVPVLLLYSNYGGDPGVGFEISSTATKAVVIYAGINVVNNSIWKVGGSGGGLYLGSGSETISGAGNITVNPVSGSPTPNVLFGFGTWSHTGTVTIASGVSATVANGISSSYTNNGTTILSGGSVNNISGTGPILCTYRAVDPGGGVPIEVSSSITGVNTCSGQISVTTGLLGFSNTASPGTQTISITSPGRVFFAIDGVNVYGVSGNGTIRAQNSLGTAKSFNIGLGNTSSTFNGTIVGGGGFTKLGTGSFTLIAASTYTGNTDLTGGTLDIQNNQALGVGGTLTVRSGTTIRNSKSPVATVTLSNPITLADNFSIGGSAGTSELILAGIVTMNTKNIVITTVGNVNTISGSINSSSYGLTVTGPGALHLGGTNTFKSLTIDDSNVGVSTAQALGDPTYNIAINGSSGSSINNYLGTLLTLSNYTYKVNNNLLGLGSELNLGTGGFDLLKSVTVTGLYSNLTIGGVVSGPYRLTIGNGITGSVYLANAANTFSDGLTIEGTCIVGSEGSLGATPVSFDSDNIIFNGGTLVLSTTTNINANRGVAMNGNGSISGTNGFGLSGGVSGSGALAIYNTGTNSFTGTNTHTGGTTFAGGTTTFSSDSVATSGDITFDNAPTLVWGSGNTYDISSRAVLNGSPYFQSANTTFTTPFKSWTGPSLHVVGSTLILGPSFTHTGAHTLYIDSSTVTINNTNAIGTAGTLVVNTSSIANLVASGTQGFALQFGFSGDSRVSITGSSFSLPLGITALGTGRVDFDATGTKSFGAISATGSTVNFLSNVSPNAVTFTGSIIASTLNLLGVGDTADLNGSSLVISQLNASNYYLRVNSASSSISNINLQTLASGIEISGSYPTIASLLTSIDPSSIGYLSLTGNSAESVDFSGFSSLMLGCRNTDVTYSGTITDPANQNRFFVSGGKLAVATAITGTQSVKLWGFATGYLELTGANTSTGSIDSITGSSWAANILVASATPYNSFSQIKTRELKITANLETLATPVYAATITNENINTISGAITHSTTGGILVSSGGELHLSGPWTVAMSPVTGRIQFAGSGATYLDGTLTWGTGARSQVYKTSGTGDVIITGSFAQGNSTPIFIGSTDINAGRVIAANNNAFNTSALTLRTITVTGSGAGTSIIGLQGNITISNNARISCTATAKTKYNATVTGDPTVLTNISGNNTFAGTVRSTSSLSSQLHVRSESGSMTVGSAFSELTFTSLSLGLTQSHVLDCKNGASMDVAAKITGGVAANIRIVKVGTGDLTLSNSANNFAAKSYILSGKVSVPTTAISGSTGYLGSNSTIALGGSLDLTNTSPETISRGIEIWGSNPVLSANGSGTLTVSSIFTVGDGGTYTNIGGTVNIQAAPGASGTTFGVSFPELAAVGMTVSGTGVPPNTQITSINLEAQTITVNQAVSCPASTTVLTLSGGGTIPRKIGLSGSSSLVNTFGTTLSNIGPTQIGLRKQGTGTWYIPQDNSGMTGESSVEGGSLHITYPTGLGNGDVVLSGGTLVCEAPGTSKLHVNGKITFSGGTISL